MEPALVSQYALDYLRHKLVVGTHVPIVSRLTLDATLRFQDRAGQYTDFDGNICDYRPFALIDTRLTWQHPLYELHLKANNLLNTRYRDYGLVPQPGRWLIVGITTHL